VVRAVILVEVGTAMASAGLVDHFANLVDPRMERTRWHGLIDIVAITVCAVICGADNWVDVALFGRSKEAWFRQWLELPNGIPSHDTFGRVFAMLDGAAFAGCFRSWMAAVQEATQGQVVAIDGKSVRGSRDRIRGKGAIHLVSAWACSNHLVLGQVKVDDKSNEITAIPELLRLLSLKGCIVTIDAMGCQKAIAQEIVEKEADYVLAVKANQGELHEGLKDLFQTAMADQFRDVPHSYAQSLNKEHGRIESRECWAISDRECLSYLGQAKEWPGLASVVMVRRQRDAIGQSDSQSQVETAYYISSLQADAEKLLATTRTHWSIENGLHWTLDVAFDEDRCRIRVGNGAQNLATVRAFALGLLKKDTSIRAGIRAKRKVAGWDPDYLFRLINQ
jgi:predicted transposase YbfD/YdcC